MPNIYTLSQNMKNACGRFKLFATLTFFFNVISVILRGNLNTTDNHFAKYERPLSIDENNGLKMVIQVYVNLTLTFDAQIIFL